MKHFVACTGMVLSLIAGPTVNAEQACLKKAWAGVNASNYAQAMEAANDCIEQFSARAFRDQAALEAAHEKFPPTGAVDSASDKKKIFDRWAVNDISTAYFLRGQAAEQLLKRTHNSKMKQVAIESYTAATRLGFGRCWDPQGWFWSPAEAAADRLLVLR